MKKLLMISLVSMLVLASFQISFAKPNPNKNPKIEEVLQYTNEDLEKFYIPMGKTYEPLPQGETIYFIENIAQELKYDIEPIGMVSLKYSMNMTNYNMGERAPYKDFYILLKDFARLKGGNVIRLAEERNTMQKKVVSMSYNVETTLEIGKKIDKNVVNTQTK